MRQGSGKPLCWNALVHGGRRILTNVSSIRSSSRSAIDREFVVVVVTPSNNITGAATGKHNSDLCS